MDNQSVKLIVDEEVQGYTKEIHSVDELKDIVNDLLDARVMEVRIAKMPPFFSRELRRFELLTDDEQDVEEVERILCNRGITRQELAKILFTVRVRPGFQKADFGISGDRWDNGLRAFKTCELVKELERREGVEAWTAEPYTELRLPVHGPAVVLVVTD